MSEVVALASREDTLRDISEGYRTAYGVRPDLSRYIRYSAEELETEAQQIAIIADQAVKQVDIDYAEAAARFEGHLSAMMADHEIDRETAIRWDMDAMELSKDDLDFYGMDLYAHRHGLRFGYFKKVA